MELIDMVPESDSNNLREIENRSSATREIENRRLRSLLYHQLDMGEAVKLPEP